MRLTDLVQIMRLTFSLLLEPPMASLVKAKVERAKAKVERAKEKAKAIR